MRRRVAPHTPAATRFACTLADARVHRYHTYTHWCNVADFPAVVIPVTRVDPALDPKIERSDYHGDMDKHFWEQCACRRLSL